MRSAEPGRRALLGAGQRLLAEEPLTRLSINAITAEAKMAKGSFYQHWRSRHEFFLALHRTFHDELLRIVSTRMTHQPPGLERLTIGMNTYLDVCLAEPATKALLVQARTDAGLADEVAVRNQQAAGIVIADLEAIGWQSPEPVAILLIAAIAEAALQELTTGGRREDLRDALIRLADRPTAVSTARADSGDRGMLCTIRDRTGISGTE
ncbi:helix-turn-helix domain-containing protein [Nocardia sp. NPDC049220]|uniref:TetR/AcrR family transcriptional regulator n=1 Tax=Nocardia sp. NPDC049220 TaxID=3155273 RepID=UPI0033F43700